MIVWGTQSPGEDFYFFGGFTLETKEQLDDSYLFRVLFSTLP